MGGASKFTVWVKFPGTKESLLQGKKGFKKFLFPEGRRVPEKKDETGVPLLFPRKMCCKKEINLCNGKKEGASLEEAPLGMGRKTKNPLLLLGKGKSW